MERYYFWCTDLLYSPTKFLLFKIDILRKCRVFKNAHGEQIKGSVVSYNFSVKQSQVYVLFNTLSAAAQNVVEVISAKFTGSFAGILYTCKLLIAPFQNTTTDFQIMLISMYLAASVSILKCEKRFLKMNVG